MLLLLFCSIYMRPWRIQPCAMSAPTNNKRWPTGLFANFRWPQAVNRYIALRNIRMPASDMVKHIKNACKPLTKSGRFELTKSKSLALNTRTLKLCLRKQKEYNKFEVYFSFNNRGKLTITGTGTDNPIYLIYDDKKAGVFEKRIVNIIYDEWKVHFETANDIYQKWIEHRTARPKHPRQG